MKKERARSPKNTKSKRRRASMGDLWGTVGKGDDFLEGEMSFDDLQLDDLAKDSKAASTKTLADTDEKASDNGGAAAAAAVPASPDFAPRLALILQYMLHRRNSGKSLPEGGVEVTVLEDCTAKHILKGKARAFRKAAGKLWLCKSQLQTGLFKQGLANKFDIQGLWPAGMELVSVGKGKVKGERFSAVRKAVQAAKARPLTLRFELADDFKPALASALKMDTDALRAHLQATVQECQPILCRPLEWGDATALPTDLLWAASAQMMHEIPVDQDDWGNYCNVLFEATTPQTLQWVMHALRFVEETLAIASLDTASSTYKPPISLSDTRIHMASTAVAAVMSKQALWNLNDLDDDNEPNLMALQKIARKRLQSNKNAIEQRYIACGWDKTVGSQIPSRPGQPRHNGVGLVPTPLHLLLNDDISSNGDVAYLCLLSMLAIAFRGPLTAAMDTLGGFEMAGSKGEGVHIKSFAQMLRLLSTEHSTHKEPRGASNTDILSTSRCFASVEELLAGYKRLTTIGTVLRCTNWYRAEADPPAHQPAGSRSIVAIVQFSVPSLKDPKVKIDIGTLMQLPGIVQACEEWEDSPLMAGWEDRVHEAREFLHSADVSRRAASMLVMVELMLEQHGAHRLGTQAYHLISRAQNPRELQQLFETR